MTTRASIASSSMPTSDTLAQASTTMPFSRMRSMTSARLDESVDFWMFAMIPSLSTPTQARRDVSAGRGCARQRRRRLLDPACAGLGPGTDGATCSERMTSEEVPASALRLQFHTPTCAANFFHNCARMIRKVYKKQLVLIHSRVDGR